MPEICELRSDADLLDFFISERTLENIQLEIGLFSNKTKGLEELSHSLPLKIEWVKSRAKKLIIKLASGWFIIMAYGMTGGISSTKRKQSHIRFTLSDCWIGFNTFYYQDTRRIGNFTAINNKNEYINNITDMAEPFVLGYDTDYFRPITLGQFKERIKLNGRKRYLLSSLDDQRSIGSGLGNYLLSEIFYDAQLDPWIHCHELSEAQIETLFTSIEKIIKLSHKHGGNSMSDYFHIDDKPGTFGDHIKVYQKDGSLDCKGRLIKKRKAPHGRSVFYIDEQVQ